MMMMVWFKYFILIFFLIYLHVDDVWTTTKTMIHIEPLTTRISLWWSCVMWSSKKLSDREVTKSLSSNLSSSRSHSYSHKCQAKRRWHELFTKIKWKRKSFNDSNSSIKPPMSQTTCSSFVLSPLGHWLDESSTDSVKRHDNESYSIFGRSL